MNRRKILLYASEGILTKPVKKGIPENGVRCIFDEDILKVELEVCNIYHSLGYTLKDIKEFKENGEFDILKEVVKNAG